MAEKLRKRNEVEEQYKWSINDLVASNEAWEKALPELMAEAAEFAQFKGTLGNGPQALLKCLLQRDETGQKIGRQYVYAQLKIAEDSTDPKNQSMADRSESLIVEFYTYASFIESEITAIGKKKLAEFMDQEPALKLYNHLFEDILRQAEHILSPELEEILTKVTELTQAPDNIYSMLNDADMKFGTVLENGEEVEITHGRFSVFMESDNRQLRKEVFDKFYTAYANQKNTIAATYAASVKSNIFFARQRKYGSSLEASLSSNNIPVDVYHNLLDTVGRHLPDMHKYISLRKKALGVGELHMYDIYTPMTGKADTFINFDNAGKTVLKALNPLGQEYLDTVAAGFKDRWIDIYENQGKRSGAFAWGAYGCHPYVLLNFNDKIEDMFTLAHEMGHALQDYYSWAAQPYIYSDFSIFIAEVASTVNEALLMEYLLETTKDQNMVKYLVNYYIEQFRGTLFRQTMFAEFEMRTHALAEKGEALTSLELNQIYRELNEKYYGPDIVLDSLIDYEWSRIPHFYTPFYVYQYATGYSAAIAISKRILAEGQPAVDDYIKFLKAGSSGYPIDVLKLAGVDMSSPKPVDDALEVFGGLVERFSKFFD